MRSDSTPVPTVYILVTEHLHIYGLCTPKTLLHTVELHSCTLPGGIQVQRGNGYMHTLLVQLQAWKHCAHYPHALLASHGRGPLAVSIAIWL